ncbi:MAG: hypothetical protein WC327_02040 [Candidatus Cloacimonadia bacterium]
MDAIQKEKERLGKFVKCIVYAKIVYSISSSLSEKKFAPALLKKDIALKITHVIIDYYIPYIIELFKINEESEECSYKNKERLRYAIKTYNASIYLLKILQGI